MTPPERLQRYPLRSALRLSLGYALAGFLWILFSDRAVEILFADSQAVFRISTYKGWFFVGITALVLFGLVLRRERHLRQEAQALQDSEGRFKALVDQTLAGIYIIQDGVFRYVNHRFCEIFGYANPEEVINHTQVSQLVCESDRDAVTKNLHQLTVGEADVLVYTFRGARKNGLERRVEVHGRALEYMGKPAVIGVLLDITDRMQQEHELGAYRAHLEEMVQQRTEAMQAALVQAESANRAKSAFLANMGHEIRTPMNAILGSTHALLSVRQEPEQLEKVSMIDSAARQLLRVLNDVLDLSSIESGRIALHNTDFVLEDMLQSLLRSLEPEAKAKGLQLDIQRDGVPARLRGDPERLAQALENYLSNAIKFTEQGRIDLKVEVLSRSPDGSGLVRFAVQDTGVGVAPDILPHLFSDFTQGDNSMTRRYGGTGLGLAINRRLAALMGGEVGAESRQGEGSCFWLTARLGLSAEAAPENKVAAQPGDPARVLPAGWPEHVAAIDGLDLQRGAVISRSNYPRYVRLLKMFADNHRNDLARMQAAFRERGGREALLTVAHALKGAAGNLGAAAVFDAARAVVEGIREEVPEALLQGRMTRLSECLPVLVSAIDGLTDHSQEEVPVADAESTKMLLLRLTGLLADGDMAVNELVREQASTLSVWLGSDFQQLLHFVDTFDYEAALGLLRNR